MLKLNPFKKSAEEPPKRILDTIFDCADKDQAHEVIFEPQRVEKPTETEGIPMPIVPLLGVWCYSCSIKSSAALSIR